MSGGQFDYIESNILELVNEYEHWNNYEEEDGEKYSEDIDKIPKRFIELLENVYEITHDIDWDLSGDTGVGDGYFDKKKKELIGFLNKN